MRLGGPGNGNNPWLLLQQPSQGNLGGRHFLLRREFSYHFYQRLIRLSIFLAEARNIAAEIGSVEFRVFIDCAREEALAQRTERNKADSKFFQGWQHFRFGLSPPQRIFALERRDRLDCVRAAGGLYAGFGQAKVLHLALLNQLFDRPGDVFNGHVWVNPMLIEQINHVGFQPLKRGFDDLLDVLGLTVQAALFSAVAIESELRCDDDLPTKWSERFSDDSLVGKGA